MSVFATLRPGIIVSANACSVASSIATAASAGSAAIIRSARGRAATTNAPAPSTPARRMKSLRDSSSASRRAELSIRGTYLRSPRAESPLRGILAPCAGRSRPQRRRWPWRRGSPQPRVPTAASSVGRHEPVRLHPSAGRRGNGLSGAERGPVLRGVRQTPPERGQAGRGRLPVEGAQALLNRERQVLLLPARPLGRIGLGGHTAEPDLRLG